jgi:hypothetical protein
MSKFDRNLEAISAYLDEELPENERALVEKQLEADADLKAWYEQLKKSKTMLRSTPKLRVPRNYFLSAEMVGQAEKPKWAFPILRFASAFAALMLLLVFLGDYLVLQNFASSPARLLQTTAGIQAEKEQTLSAQDSVESEIPAAAEEPLMQEIPEEEELPAAEAAEGNMLPSMAPSPMVEKIIPTQVMPPLEEFEGLVGEAGEEGDTASPIPESQDSASPIDLIAQRLIENWLWIRITEFALLSITVITAIAAIYLYRRGR